MAAKSSDDPMDLGGFMQNFVLSNPFKDMHVIPSGKDSPEADPKDSLSLGSPDQVVNSTDSSPGGSVKGSSHDGERNLVIAVDSGQVLDTPKAHVGSNVVFAAALKLQKVSGAHAKVQKWLKNNYIHEPSYPLCKDARELIAEVQEHFPHITNMTLSKIMTFTFPNSLKVTNISGFHGYKGLLGKPQPEDYCNLDLLKAVSHCKLYGSISEAAQLYSVPASSVASLHYWHPDLASLPVHVSVAEELVKNEPLVFSHRSAIPHPKKSSNPTRQHGIPVDYCDLDSFMDPESEHSESSDVRQASPLGSGQPLPTIKTEPQDTSVDNHHSNVNNDNGMAYSLLRNLLRQPRLDRFEEKAADHNKKVAELNMLDLPNDVCIKTEPVSPGYEECDVDRVDFGAMEKANNSCNNTASGMPKDLTTSKAAVSQEDLSLRTVDVAKLRSEVQQLKTRLSQQISKNQKQEVQLLLSQKEVLRLKSVLCTQEVTIAELSQGFDNLHQQFTVLKRKFRQALDKLDSDDDQPVKKRANYQTTVNGNNA